METQKSHLRTIFFVIYLPVLVFNVINAKAQTEMILLPVKRDAVKVDDYSKIDFSKYNKNKDSTKKDSTQDSSLKVMQKLIDSLMTSKNKVVQFDCKKPEATKPLSLGSLNTVYNEVFDVTKSTGVNLNLFGVSPGFNKKDILIQANFFVFKDYSCDDGSITRALVGMTMYLHVSDLKVSLTTKSLPNIPQQFSLEKQQLFINYNFTD